MRTFTAPTRIPEDARGASIALGNFDGVHVGHQAVIAAARSQGGVLATALFEPHPREFFHADGPHFRLQSSAQRARCLEALGVQQLFEIAFNQSLAQMSHRDFARLILHERLGARHVSVGQNFRFGHGRMGDVAELERLGEEFGFGVSAIGPVRGEDGRISSTAIRAAIAAGEMQNATTMLGRPWVIEGQVQRGFARGRGFGFATANVALGEYQRPRLGVYAVRVRIGDARHDGVASVGVNPTVGALPEPLLEAHIFGFDRALYGEAIEVELIAFLREEAAFDDTDALKAQMALDSEAAKAALQSHRD